jgi:hypothetical protein
MTISLPDRPCNQLSWDMPCPPDGSNYPSPIEPLLTFLVAYALLAIGLMLYHVLIRKRRPSLTLQNARQAAQRISSALCTLPLLQEEPTAAICKSIATDLLFIIDYNLFEITRNWVYQPIEPNMAESVQTVCQEALRLRQPLERARVFLSFKPLAMKGQGLTMEAAARYTSVFTPALRQLHEKRSGSQDFIPIFEIDMPNSCENFGG